MKLSDFAQEILFRGEIDSKLIEIDKIEWDNFQLKDIPKFPARNEKIKIVSKNSRFPRGHFHLDEKKAMALHSFANHELLAIEMMACALVLYPHDTDELKKFKHGVLSSLKDEQKHFSMYCERLNELGYEFGDFPLNDFFWNQMQSLKTPAQYLSVMALTFEAANLDFAHFYKHIFKQVGDDRTADILEIVLVDEITHVGLGVHFLNKWKQNKSLWEYYNENLPWPLTPARGKGKIFVEEARRKARMDDFFITSMKNYQDKFKVTSRKEWKS